MIATLIAAVALALFLGAAYGLFAQASWWRPIAIVGAVLSAALIVAFWDGLPTGPAVSALVFNMLILGAPVVVHWPSEGIAGA